MRTFLPTLGAFLGVLACGAAASGQQGIPAYRPARPSVSPYLYLTQPDVGQLPNYYAFVRPLREQMETNRIERENMTEFEQRLRSQQQAAEGTATGVGATYLDYGHFYPGYQANQAQISQRAMQRSQLSKNRIRFSARRPMNQVVGDDSIR